MYTEKPRFGPEQYLAGATIIRQGDLPDKFYIIVSGYVGVEHSGSEGLHIIDHLGPGDFFGETGLIKQKRRNATVRAESDVTVMSMDQQTFASWLNTSGLVQAEMAEVMDIRERRVGRWSNSDDEQVATGTLFQAKMGVDEQTAVPHNTLHPTGQGPLHFTSGQTIVRQGAPANRFYIIIEGEVEVMQQDEKGQEMVISHLNDGQYFGEIGLLEGSPRTATIRALTDVKALPFTRDQFRSWLDKSPDSKDDIEQTAQKRLARDTGALPPLEEGKR